MMKNELTQMLQKHVPAEAVDYCVQLWENKHFSFTVSRTRSSCFGNHCYRPDKGHHITVNHDLNPHAFLLTYVHEVAHLKTFEDNQRTFLQKMLKRRPKRIDPHGEEWKESFRVLMQPILNQTFFPKAILEPLEAYMQNPKASSVSYHPLAKALHLNDKEGEFLSDLDNGQAFVFRGNTYTKIEERRTRILCEDQTTRKRFLIAGIAKVELVEADTIRKVQILNLDRLKDLPDGQQFILDKTVFIKKEKRRTRVLCEELSSKKMYLISGDAVVEATVGK
jgi:SprT protein